MLSLLIVLNDSLVILADNVEMKKKKCYVNAIFITHCAIYNIKTMEYLLFSRR